MKLQRKKIGQGQYVKVPIIVEVKVAPRIENKVDKSEVSDKSIKPADFTAIPHVGVATARLLVSKGITTFEQLRQLDDLDLLPANVRRAILTWRGE